MYKIRLKLIYCHIAIIMIIGQQNQTCIYMSLTKLKKKSTTTMTTGYTCILSGIITIDIPFIISSYLPFVVTKITDFGVPGPPLDITHNSTKLLKLDVLTTFSEWFWLFCKFFVDFPSVLNSRLPVCLLNLALNLLTTLFVCGFNRKASKPLCTITFLQSMMKDDRAPKIEGTERSFVYIIYIPFPIR